MGRSWESWSLGVESVTDPIHSLDFKFCIVLANQGGHRRSSSMSSNNRTQIRLGRPISKYTTHGNATNSIVEAEIK
jgi:hypothetical protein